MSIERRVRITSADSPASQAGCPSTRIRVVRSSYYYCPPWLHRSHMNAEYSNYITRSRYALVQPAWSTYIALPDAEARGPACMAWSPVVRSGG